MVKAKKPVKKRKSKVPPKKPLDDARVMDVSKPGTTKPMAGSRPIVVTTLGAAVGIDKDPNLKQPELTKAVAPSQARKVIAPVSSEVKPEEDSSEEVAETTAVKITLGNKDEESPKLPIEEAEPEAAASENSAESGESDSVPANDTKTKPEPEPVAADDESSDADTNDGEAAVGALANEVSTKKAEEKAIEEQAKKDVAIQELISSKKYFVPLAHDSTKKKHSKAPGVILLLLLVLIIAGYAAVDLGVIDPGFDVPYHILKK